MPTVQQRVREVLGSHYECKSEYWSGRGGHSMIRLYCIQPGMDIIQTMKSTFETWKMVREDQDRTDEIYHFIIRSKKGILRGVVSYSAGSTVIQVSTQFNDDLEKLHTYNRNFKPYPGATIQVTSYEKISQG